MRPLLMFSDRDFVPDHEDKPGEDDLIHDLDLDTLWDAAAGANEIIRASVRTAMLDPLQRPADIGYRNQAFQDCLALPEVVHDLFDVACQALDGERQIYREAFFSCGTEALLRRSMASMNLFVSLLERLRTLARQHADELTSPAFTGFVATLSTELSDDYFAEIAECLRVLRFRDGLIASARLGSHHQGVDYVLRTPLARNRTRLLHQAPVRHPHYSLTLANDDDGAHQDLAQLRERILAQAADSLAQAVEHIKGFFVSLQAELAFYLGCLTLHDELTSRSLPFCLPEPHTPGSSVLTAEGLYDPCLALRSPDPLQANTLRADGRSLIVVTGANQGGKSTFLRSVGLAHLMMQAGIPVAATAFRASVVTGVFTHYAREEDATMTTGKLDEELARMSAITHRLRSHGLLLCNESFSTTNEREASEIADDILRALGQAGITVVFVTHLYELAHRLHQRHATTTLFLRADRDDAGQRDHLLREGEPLPTAYGQDLYHRTFPDTPALGKLQSIR